MEIYCTVDSHNDVFVYRFFLSPVIIQHRTYRYCIQIESAIFGKFVDLDYYRVRRPIYLAEL